METNVRFDEIKEEIKSYKSSFEVARGVKADAVVVPFGWRKPICEFYLSDNDRSRDFQFNVVGLLVFFGDVDYPVVASICD